MGGCKSGFASVLSGIRSPPLAHTRGDRQRPYPGQGFITPRCNPWQPCAGGRTPSAHIKLKIPHDGSHAFQTAWSGPLSARFRSQDGEKVSVSTRLTNWASARKRLSRTPIVGRAAYRAWRAVKLAAAALALSLLTTATVHALPVDDPNIAASWFMDGPITLVDIPGIGPVYMTGFPVGPGTTSTVIHRDAALPLPNVGDSGTVPITMTKLSLKSTNPVPAFNSFFDVFVELDPASLGLDTGTITINRTSTDGGTFDATIDVVSRITLTELGNPLNTQVIGFTDQFTTANAPWSFTPSPNSVDFAVDPLSGMFAGVIPGTGGVATSFVFAGTQTQSQLTLLPAMMPEPGTLALIGLGFGVMGWGRRAGLG